MKIVIDLTELSYHMTGVERYATHISLEMLKQDPTNSYVLVFKDSVFPLFEQYIDNKRVESLVLQGKNKLIFYQIILPRKLRKIKADKYLFMAFPSPILFKKKGIYNTIHDMGAWDFGEAMKFKQRLYWKKTIKAAVKASSGVITVSEFSKSRIASILKCNIDKIRVIYSGIRENLISENINFSEIKNIYNLPDKYIMTLSTLEPRKNLALVLKAFYEIQDKVDYDLVLIGRKGWKMDDVINNYISSNRIHITGFVDDKHISSIYKQALCFIFPSFYEGFGLPPIEALCLGTPVISSDASCMPEILRNQATFFKNNDIDDLRQHLLTLNDNISSMPKELDEYQKTNYNFKLSAAKVLEFLNE